MKKKYWVGILGFIFLIILILFLFKKENYFNKIEFNSNNIIVNTTKVNYLDTILQVGLNEIKIDNIVILLRPYKNNIKIKSNEREVFSYIIGGNNQYIIYINPQNRIENIDFLSHELIHLLQLKYKKLIIKGSKTYWEGKIIYNANNIEYFQRPWEKEAIYFGDLLSIDLKKILLKF